jgi:uncharacterized membrane protein
MLQNNPVYLIAVLLLLVFFAEWLSQKKYFKYLGSALIVIIAGAILSNLHLIPTSHDLPALYNGIFTYIAPLAIFYLLLDVKLKDIRLAGLPMLTMFFVGAACTIGGTLIGYHFLAPQNHNIEKAYAVAGMFVGTYTGGSANLNAIGVQYGVINNGSLFAAINAADNIISTVWLVSTVLLPSLLQRLVPRKSFLYKEPDQKDIVLPIITAKQNITVAGFSLLLALGLGSLTISQVISSYVPQIPMILLLTTIALLLAQVKPLHKVDGGPILGFLFVLVFLAVVGAHCDLHALIQNKEVALTLMGWVTAIVFIHGVLIFTIGGLLKQDWNIISIASNANIGGATTAGVLAMTLKRGDLRLPGILVGSVGNAIGTYAGVLVAEYLR